MLLACTDLSSNSEVDIERRRNRQAFEKVAAYYRIYCKMIDRFFQAALGIFFFMVLLFCSAALIIYMECTQMNLLFHKMNCSGCISQLLSVV